MAKGTGFVNHALGVTMNVGGELMSGTDAKTALVKGAFWFAAEAVVPGASWVQPMAAAGDFATQQYLSHKYEGKGKVQSYYRPGFGGNFQDSQSGYTMRQRSVQAMQQSKINARSVLGSEAKTFHTSFR